MIHDSYINLISVRKLISYETMCWRQESTLNRRSFGNFNTKIENRRRRLSKGKFTKEELNNPFEFPTCYFNCEKRSIDLKIDLRMIDPPRNGGNDRANRVSARIE